jgi:hypothetical protein
MQRLRNFSLQTKIKILFFRSYDEIIDFPLNAGDFLFSFRLLEAMAIGSKIQEGVN